MRFDAADQSEVRVTVGDGSCSITSYTDTMISCVPPQSGSGIVNVTVSVAINQPLPAVFCMDVQL